MSSETVLVLVHDSQPARPPNLSSFEHPQLQPMYCPSLFLVTLFFFRSEATCLFFDFPGQQAANFSCAFP